MNNDRSLKQKERKMKSVRASLKREKEIQIIRDKRTREKK